jgi:hypothetical protein
MNEKHSNDKKTINCSANEQNFDQSLNAKFDQKLNDKNLSLISNESKKELKSPNKIYFTDYAKQRLKVSFISFLFRNNLQNILILSIN